MTNRLPMTADKDKVFRPLSTNVDVIAGILNARNIMITELLPPLKNLKELSRIQWDDALNSLVIRFQPKQTGKNHKIYFQWPWCRRLRKMIYSAKKKTRIFRIRRYLVVFQLLGPICLFMITNAIS